MQARAAVKGQALVNEAAPIFHEYVMRKRLAKLGYVSDMSTLSAFKAECFYLIDVEVDDTQAKEAQRRGNRKR